MSWTCSHRRKLIAETTHTHCLTSHQSSAKISLRQKAMGGRQKLCNPPRWGRSSCPSRQSSRQSATANRPEIYDGTSRHAPDSISIQGKTTFEHDERDNLSITHVTSALMCFKTPLNGTPSQPSPMDSTASRNDKTNCGILVFPSFLSLTAVSMMLHLAHEWISEA